MPTLASDGSQLDVYNKCEAASAGDTVTMPAGTFTWGAAAAQCSITKAITLEGAGQGQTIINMSSGSPTYTNGIIIVFAAATIKGFTVNAPAGTTSATVFGMSTTSGWRVTDIEYNGTAGCDGYFLYAASYGLIDNCDLYSPNGAQELVVGRGPTDSWQTANSLGGANNVFIEDCVFSGNGYVCDANSNARFVVRYNTIDGPMKIDGHGKASNTPARGVRHIEAYNNTWVAQGAGSSWNALELRGGGGRIFNNVNEDSTSASRGTIALREYGCIAQWPNFSNTYQTPTDYPVGDQVGVGIDPKAGGSEPMYLWGNTKDGAQMPFDWYADLTGAIALYGSSFTMQDIIEADRDYFTEDTTFDGTTGVGVGTLAAMNAIMPTTTGVGFWVEADSELYVWDGADWVLDYSPYTYPHPLRIDPMADNLTLNQTANTDPVTELWKRGAAPSTAPSEVIIQHSGDYPSQPLNDYVYAKHGTTSKHVFVFPGTITLAQAVASRP